MAYPDPRATYMQFPITNWESVDALPIEPMIDRMIEQQIQRVETILEQPFTSVLLQAIELARASDLPPSAIAARAMRDLKEYLKTHIPVEES